MAPPRCICQICSCGRHRCCHRTTRIYDTGAQPYNKTEYGEKYPGYGSVCPPESCRPSPQIRPDHGAMNSTSTFKSDYIPHEVKLHSRTQPEYRPKSGDIDLGTVYRRDYSPHKVGPVVLARPRESRHTTGARLDTVPTYRDDYILRKGPRSESCKVERPYEPPSERFGNPSTFQDDYIPRKPNPPASCKPCDVKLATGPFDANTIHRTAYIVHDVEPMFVRPREEYKPSDQPLDSLTTHRRDFKGAPGEQAQPFNPQPHKLGSDAPFRGITEFQDRYQPWLVTPPESCKPKEYVPPTEKMDLNSSNRLDYISHKAPPAAPIRPPPGRRTSAPFQGKTTMREDFQPMSPCQRGIIKNEPQIPRPTGKFSGLTTFRSHYIPHQANPAQSCKPVQTVSSGVPFKDETMYRTEYTPKKPEACPGHHPDALGYVYVSTDSQGHKYYRPVSPEHSCSSCNPVPQEVAGVS